MRSARGTTARSRLEALLRSFTPDGLPRAQDCLIARSCGEISALSDIATSAVRAGADSQRQVLVELLMEGRLAGELPENADIEAMAWYYLGILQAATNLPKAAAPAGAIERMIDVAMSAWPKQQ